MFATSDGLLASNHITCQEASVQRKLNPETNAGYRGEEACWMQNQESYSLIFGCKSRKSREA